MLNGKIKDYFTIKKKQKLIKKRTNAFLKKIQKVNNNKEKMKKKSSLALSNL